MDNSCEILSTATTICTSKYAHVVGVLSSLNAQRRTHQSKLCDVELKMADGILHCHKSVLVTCSKYFEAMFSHDAMIENVEGKVDLSQFTIGVMDSLLNFIYTGDMQLSTDNVCERLAAARYLQIDGVVETCCKFIIESLSPANYADYLNEISCLSLRDTELEIQRYIESQMCDEFAAASEGQYSKLTFDYLRQLLGTDNNLPHIKSEYEIFKLAIMWLKEDPDTRREHTGQLLCECVRYPLIPLNDLTDHVLPYVCSKNDSNLFKAGIDAQTYHLRPDQHVSQYGGLRSTTLRFYTDAIITLPQKGSRFLQMWHHPIEESTAIATSNAPEFIRQDAAIAEMDGFIYVAGGQLNETGVRVVQRYNPRNNMWFVCQSMKQGRYSFSLTALDGKLYAVGGFANSSQHTPTVESYDVKNDQWTNVASVIGPTYHRHGATVVGDKLYIAGGERGAIQCYDPVINKWQCLVEELECLAKKRVREMCSIGDMLYILVTAADNREMKGWDIYRFSLDSGEPIPPMRDAKCCNELICTYLEMNMIRIIAHQLRDRITLVGFGSRTHGTTHVSEEKLSCYEINNEKFIYSEINSTFSSDIMQTRRVRVPKFMMNAE
ncbi:kelch-like protein 36 [Amphiura filiformis]|uniref:kelch-like protein 36 n=1 Tax=Amphiura filiformis TaxID=82378 RepID=UPI003B21AE7B